jgi:hypothetical protein
MRRSLLAIVFGSLAVGGMTLAHHDEHGKGGVNTLSQKDINEKIDGKKSKATTVEVTLGPGASDAPHRHPGPAFGYVLEGEYEWAIDDNPAKILKGRRYLLRADRLPAPGLEEPEQERQDAHPRRGAASHRRQGHRHPGKEPEVEVNIGGR